MQETRHTADNLRYLLNSPAGIIEARLRADHAFIVHHQPGCDAEHCNDECDAEIGQGAEAALMFQASGSDNTIWAILREYALRADLADISQPPHEWTEQTRQFAAHLIASGEWIATIDVGPGPYFTRPNPFRPEEE